MKTLIAVRGVANRGKSASIKEVYLLLKRAYPGAEFEDIFIGADITAIITINGLKVGVESQGDPNSRLFKSLPHFVRRGCQVIICATRTRGETVDLVNKYADRYSVSWLDKSSAPNEDAANRATALKILAMVQSSLGA